MGTRHKMGEEKPGEPFRTSGHRKWLARGIHGIARARIYRDATALVYEGGSASYARRRQRAESRGGRAGGGGVVGRAVRTFYHSLRGDFHCAGGGRAVHDPATQRGGQAIGNDEGLRAGIGGYPASENIGRKKRGPRAGENRPAADQLNSEIVRSLEQMT